LNRAFTFSHPRIAELLNENYIPFAGNTAEYQPEFGGQGADAAWFSKMARQTDYKVQGETAQGMYVAGADGTAYAWKNTPGISATIRFLEKGIADYTARPPAQVELSEPAPSKYLPKPSTTVLSVISRVRPVPEGADNRNYNVGRDTLWLYQYEIQEMLDAPPDKLRLPPTFIARFCRYSLVDLIRGEPDYWGSRDVREADFTLEKKAQTDATITFAFHGKFRMGTGWFTRGMDGTMEGEFELDRTTERATRFRAYAQTKAWGTPTYGYRGVPKGIFPLVFAIVDDDTPFTRDIAPSCIARKQHYYQPEIDVLKAAAR
jgi:hypothetical protein